MGGLIAGGEPFTMLPLDSVNLHCGDCLDLLSKYESGCVDLIYLDPPFFTNQVHRLTTRDRTREFSFDDLWSDQREYASFLFPRISQLHRVLRDTGTLFLHCDRNATHLARAILDQVFGAERFRSEIIWYYRRWSHSKKGLQSAHQTILYYTKSDEFTFHEIRTEYSPTTNVDQILQRRSRDASNKSIYQRDDDGNTVPAGEKKGVPLSDVWEIPALNPKAKERVGYPTQKPLALLERVLRLASNPGDMVLDPFCGSGTTVVAATLLQRRAIGIDLSPEAIDLARGRLADPVRSESKLLKRGPNAFRNADPFAMNLLRDVAAIPVQRNRGIDALLPECYDGVPIPIRVQRDGESLGEAAFKLAKAAANKGAKLMFLVKRFDPPDASQPGNDFGREASFPKEMIVVDSSALAIRKRLSLLRSGISGDATVPSDPHDVLEDQVQTRNKHQNDGGRKEDPEAQ